MNQILNKSLYAIGEEDPIFFAEVFLGLKLNPFQKRSLWALKNHKQILEVTANQIGKTVGIAIDHIWFNFYKKGISGDPELIEKTRYETLNISPVLRQSKEALRYIEEILTSNFSWEYNGKRYVNNCKISWFLEGKNEHLGRVDFSNNSSCYCLSTSEDQGAGFAGKQFAFITYDECVQSHHLEEELPARIFSRVAKYAGTIKLCSTPDELAKSQQYWYHLYTMAKKGESDWFLVEGYYDENIFIPEEKKKEYKERLKKFDPLKYRQVVLGEFIATADRVFTPEMVEGLWNEKKESSRPEEGKEYVITVDLGVSKSGDETVILVADVTNSEDVAEIVYAYSKQGGDPLELAAMISYLSVYYNSAPVVLEMNDMGGQIFKTMIGAKKIIAYSAANKPEALFFLQMRLRNNLRNDLTNNENAGKGMIKSYYISKLERELSSYKLEDKKIKQDWVMAISMLAWYVEKFKKVSKIKTYSLNNFYSIKKIDAKHKPISQ